MITTKLKLFTNLRSFTFHTQIILTDCFLLLSKLVDEGERTNLVNFFTHACLKNSASAKNINFVNIVLRQIKNDENIETIDTTKIFHILAKKVAKKSMNQNQKENLNVMVLKILFSLETINIEDFKIVFFKAKLVLSFS